jgi:signal transduction histidine kinase
MRRRVEAERLRAAIAAADAERARWARELHDQTLQALAGLRVLLATALARGDPTASEQTMRRAVADIDIEIANVRGIISDLRPAALDELGLAPAIESLLERYRRGGLRIDARLQLPGRQGQREELSPELQTTVYRVVQEALRNVAKHARASAVRVEAIHTGAELFVEIADDGVGFDPSAPTKGFGLAGMRERAALAGGELELTSGESGTCVRLRVPLAPGRTRAMALSAGRAAP